METAPHRPVGLSALALLAVVYAAPLRAQGPAPDRITVYRVASPSGATESECVRAVPESAGLPVIAYMGVPASDTVPVALREQVDNFAATLGEEMRHALGVVGDTLPYVRSRTPGLAETSVQLIVRRNGTFGWSVPDTAAWSRRTRQLLIEALQSRRTAGDVILWPDDVPGDSARMRLYVTLASLVNGKLISDETLPSAVPVFTTRILAEKPVAMKHGVTPTYPLRNRNEGWVGLVHMQFVVDTTGRAVDSTVAVVWPKSSPRLKLEENDVYKSFISAVRDGIHNSTYYPAELAGCKVQQVVQQDFVFNFATGH